LINIKTISLTHITRTMAAVRLGKNHLRWCYECNLPILESLKCPICKSTTSEVEITPPGDVRPAFDYDINKIRSLVDLQFGKFTGLELIPEGHIVLLNKAPSLDRMDEIIIDGKAVASLRYDLGRGWIFINRMQSAMRIAPRATKGLVVCDPSAMRFVQESKNLMVPGVINVTPDVKVGNEVIIVTDDHTVVGTGVAKMSANEMIALKRGVAVKTKWTKPEKPIISNKTQTWDSIINANRSTIQKRVNEAVTFIKKNIENSKIPAIVSFSGGKDSLTTLLLTLDAGYKLPVLFINTGLEFDETVEHVHNVCNKHDLKLIEESTSADIFFKNLVQFGPPAKDFRWCCKTNKLGPTVMAINKNFPNGVLSFIGQRKYESESRRSKPRIWQNPWTPGETGASPIQNWNSLHVWMYIFMKRESFNVWYTRGLDRIGCFLCPASDLSELETVSKNSDRYSQWNNYLINYMSEHGLSKEWKEYGLWRWKKTPQSICNEVNKITGKNVLEFTKQTKFQEKGPLAITIQEGYSPCIIGYSIEAALSRPINLERFVDFAHILARSVEKDVNSQWVSINNITIYREGAIISKANVEADARSAINKLFKLIIRSEQCVGCGLCVARCEQHALYIANRRVEINPDECIRCQNCFGPCPAANFGVSDDQIA
ncbi:MAG: phosphoadenosine phosphosulfate reductase family protein, partial [archaeon]|nr:phosphoadenosine phosphosulfate reductase family protein [archaeon]